MITGFLMFRSESGNWVVIIEREGLDPIGWWEWEYPTPAAAEVALTAKVEVALVRQAWIEAAA